MLILAWVRKNLKSVLIGGIAIGLVLRFVALGKQSLWVDEMLTLINAYINSDFAYLHFFKNLQGPAISAMMHLWGRISMNEAFLRLPFAILGTLSVLAFYRLSRVLQEPRESIHSMFLFSLSPMLIWYSQEIRGYAAVVLLTILMTYFLVIWIRHPSRKMMFLYGLCMLGALLSNLTACFVGFSHFVYLLTSPSRRRLLGRWLVAVFAVLLLFSPWIREIALRVAPHRSVLTGAEAPLKGGADISAYVIPYSVYTLSVGYTLGPSTRDIKANPQLAIRRNLVWITFTAGLFGIAFLAGLWQMIRTRPDTAFLLLLWFAIPMVMALTLAAINIKVFTPRYVLVSVPAYLIIVGQGLSAISRSRYYTLLFAVILIIGISIFNYYFDPSYAKDDSRSAARQIASELKSGDVVVGVYSIEALRHYLDGIAEVLGFGADDLVSDETIESRCQQVTQHAKRVWLFLCREEMVDRQGRISAWFERNLNLIRIWRYPGVELRSYEVRQTS